MNRQPLVRHALLLVALIMARSASAQEAAEPLTAAQAALVQLDQLQAAGAKDPARVLEILQRGIDGIERAERRLEQDPAATSTTAPAGGGEQRLQRCQLAFMRAELHRRAGVALPADHPERGKQLELALTQNKTLRLTYRDLAAGRLGYAGAARVQRARGDLAAAEAELAGAIIEIDEPRRITRQSGAMLQLQRVLWLERVENALAASPSKAIGLAKSLSTSALMADAAPAERAALAFVAAQAEAEALLANPAADAEAVARVVEALRDPMLAEGIPQHQRLGPLLRLSKARGVVLTPAEQLAWGRLLAWAGLDADAIDAFGAVAARASSEIPPSDWLTFGALLHRADRGEAAADALAKGLASLPPDAPQRLAVLQAIAARRVAAARLHPGEPARRKLALDASWQLAEAAGSDTSVRREALRGWAHLHQQAGTLGQHLSSLAPFADDVAGDPYLYLLTANARWQANTPPGSTTQPTAAVMELAAEIQANLARLLPEADAELRPSIVLLMAQAALATPGGPRAGLDVLAKHDSALVADTPATPEVTALKLRLLMDLGLTAEADALVSQIQGDALSTPVALRLADMLADRHAGQDQVPPAVRERIMALVTRALANHSGDGEYRASAIAGATTLLKVKAHGGAQQILDGLRNADPAVATDAQFALPYAAALEGQGKVEQAQQVLTAVVRENPGAGDVHLAAGRLQHGLKQWDAAAAAYRLARRETAAGTAAWWEATIGLAEAMVEQGHVEGARELLRVANALYRSRAPASLRTQIDALLGPASAGTGRNGSSVNNG